jgi:5-methylcytosine-specific restriction endonuclease McrA
MVFVLDKRKKPLMPCTEKRARLLLERGRARVHKMAPFTIRLIDRTVEDSVLQDLRLKLDPGSKTTGVAMTRDGARGTAVVFFGEIVHKTTIKMRLDARRTVRRGRRNRKMRYRPARFLNRKRKPGWLPPSLEARVNQTLHAVAKLQKLAPLTAISVEHVKFDTQKLENPEISGVEYQQGTLLGYEVREYLLEKWGRACVYCGATDVPLEIEHIVPKSRGGSNRVSNLALACHPCNQAKGTYTAEEFGYPDIQAQAKNPLKDAAMMNATRWRLYEQLQATGLPVEGGSGGRTKKQRTVLGLPKEHYYDALCVGESTPLTFTGFPAYVQVWSAKGRGTRQMCGTNRYGFPIRYRSRQKIHFGFQTGDLVTAVIPRGKYAGTWTGRATVKARGSLVIATNTGMHLETHYQHARVLQRSDGWQITQTHINEKKGTSGFLRALKGEAPAANFRWMPSNRRGEGHHATCAIWLTQDPENGLQCGTGVPGLKAGDQVSVGWDAATGHLILQVRPEGPYRVAKNHYLGGPLLHQWCRDRGLVPAVRYPVTWVAEDQALWVSVQDKNATP